MSKTKILTIWAIPLPSLATLRGRILEALLLCGMAAPTLSGAATWTVSAAGGGDFATVNEAMTASSAGDTVWIDAGIYRESVGLRTGVTLLGAGAEDTRIEVDFTGNPAYAVEVDSVRVKDLALAYTGDEGIATVYISGASVAFEDCHLTGGSASVVYAVAGAKLTLTNCTIDGGGSGVYLGGDSEGHVRASRISNLTWSGVAFEEGAFGSVRACTLAANGSVGILANGAGPVTVAGCTIQGNGSYGVYLTAGSRAFIDSCHITANTYGGLAADGGSSGELTASTLVENRGSGVTVNASNQMTLSGNVIARNEWVGVYAVDRARVTLRGNSVVGNGSSGLLAHSGAILSLWDNLVVWNRPGGVWTRSEQDGDAVLFEGGHNNVWDNSVVSVFIGRQSEYYGADPPASDLSTNPLFVDGRGGDYRLRPVSPLLKAGSAGGPIGALGAVDLGEAVADSFIVAAALDTVNWVIGQGGAWLNVDLYIVTGSEGDLEPIEIEVIYTRGDGSEVARRSIRAVDFKASRQRLELDIDNLWVVWNADLEELRDLEQIAIPRGGRGFFFFESDRFDPDDLPGSAVLMVRGQIEGRTVEASCRVTPRVYRQPGEYLFPLRGGGWYIGNGIPHDNHRHRGASFMGYTASMGGPAWDIYRKYRSSLWRTDGQRNADYWDYGAQVYAPAAGRIVEMRNDGREPEYGEDPGDAAVNYVKIDHQNGEISMMAHFQAGSAVVEVGQWVEQGDPIALLGASGDIWDVPHLHFQVGAPGWPEVGRPVAFSGARIVGTDMQDGMLLAGSYVEAESVGPILWVAADGSAPYTTIADAMAAAVSGDTVEVGPGTYREVIQLKDGVLLRGRGPNLTRLEFDGLGNPLYGVGTQGARVERMAVAYTGAEGVATVYLDSAAVTLAGCHLSNSAVSVIYGIGASDVSLEDCGIDQGGFGVYLAGGSVARVQGCRIEGQTWHGIAMEDRAHGDLQGNEIAGNGAHGVVLNRAGAVTMARNVLARNLGDGVRADEATGLLLHRNTITGNGGFGIRVGAVPAAELTDNAIIANGAGGVELGTSGTVAAMGYNDIWGHDGKDYAGLPPGATDLSADPDFVDVTSGDYRPRVGSPLINGGNGGGLIGALDPGPAAPEPVLPGDFDGSGLVDFADFFLFADQFGGTNPVYDFDGSGLVDFADFFLFADQFGRGG
jgi:parallel beta-helix repeat protein